ncbi:MAG: hypothetical protein V4850_30295 [Myxococcota bacterium]
MLLFLFACDLGPDDAVTLTGVDDASVLADGWWVRISHVRDGAVHAVSNSLLLSATPDYCALATEWTVDDPYGYLLEQAAAETTEADPDGGCESERAWYAGMGSHFDAIVGAGTIEVSFLTPDEDGVSGAPGPGEWTPPGDDGCGDTQCVLGGVRLSHTNWYTEVAEAMTCPPAEGRFPEPDVTEFDYGTGALSLTEDGEGWRYAVDLSLEERDSSATGAIAGTGTFTPCDLTVVQTETIIDE